MKILEARAADIQPIPHGELHCPFFDPKEIRAIKDKGNQPIDLSVFFSDHGLIIIKGHENILASLLAQYDQETHFIERLDKGAAFQAFNVEHVVSALRLSGIEELTPHVEGGAESLRKIGQSLIQAVRSGS